MSEAMEVALRISEEIGLFATAEVRFFDDALAIVKPRMEGQGVQVTDNVAEALLRLAEKVGD